MLTTSMLSYSRWPVRCEESPALELDIINRSSLPLSSDACLTSVRYGVEASKRSF